METMTGIKIDDLSKKYRSRDQRLDRFALREVDLTVEPGEFVCLLGPSGCGKTTLLNILAGLDRDYAGSVRFVGADGRHIQPKIGYVFQDARLLPWMTVRDNIAFVLERGNATSNKLDTVDEWVQRVGLDGYGQYYPNQLSIGMQQRVALARALIVDPDVVLMDEPFSSLDELTASRMRDELVQLRMERMNTVLFVTHNPLEAMYLADRVVIMSSVPGRIIDEFDVATVAPRPRSADDGRLWKLSRQAVKMLERSRPGAQGEGVRRK